MVQLRTVLEPWRLAIGTKSSASRPDHCAANAQGVKGECPVEIGSARLRRQSHLLARLLSNIVRDERRRMLIAVPSYRRCIADGATMVVAASTTRSAYNRGTSAVFMISCMSAGAHRAETYAPGSDLEAPCGRTGAGTGRLEQAIRMPNVRTSWRGSPNSLREHASWRSRGPRTGQVSSRGPNIY